MPGMNPNKIDLSNALVVSLFRHALFVSGLFRLTLIAVVLMLILVASRWILRFNLSPEGLNEPRARTYLRWGFGAVWLIDGILQFQVSMPLGLANNVIQPLTANTPSWLHSLMAHGILLWNSHPINLAVGTAWLQVGIGLALLVSNGITGRIAGLVSAAWAALIWLIGNGAGGFFVTGASFLFGWPGATAFYAMAGVWLFLKPETFHRWFSIVTLRVLAVIVALGAFLQILPSNEFWHGGNSNALTTMTSFMTKIAQPHWVAWLSRGTGTLAGSLGGGFNLVVIFWLVACAVGLWFGATKRWRWPVWALVVGCLFFWLTAQDTSLFGGLSTDFNSLLPLAVLAWCASPSLRDAPARVRKLPKELTASTGAVLATFATAMIVYSAALMSTSAFAGAETTLYQAQNGPASSALQAKIAPPFTLTDQFDKPYTLGEHPGYVTLLTFLDPRCWTDCPLLAQQLRLLRGQLPNNTKLDIVAVAADPFHEHLTDLRHFIAIRDLSHVENFYYVTGTLSAMQKVWASYDIGVTMTKSDVMSIHSDFMYIIDSKHHLRWVIPDDPIASTSGQSSAVSELRGLLADEGIR
jgi:cytochrome oxidase Cu insertion factor (SCO1/SenC/PrrC family)